MVMVIIQGLALALALMALMESLRRPRSTCSPAQLRRIDKALRQLRERVVGLEAQRDLHEAELAGLEDFATHLRHLDGRLVTLEQQVERLRREQFIAHDQIGRAWVAQQVEWDEAREDRP